MTMTKTIKVSDNVHDRLVILRKLLNAEDFDTVIWLFIAERGRSA